MPAPKLPPKREFSEPEKLTENWLIEHKDHSLLWHVHTVFNGKRGVKYRECKCYTCRKVARLKLEDVRAKVEPMPPKESRRRTSLKKSNFNTMIF